MSGQYPKRIRQPTTPFHKPASVEDLHYATSGKRRRMQQQTKAVESISTGAAADDKMDVEPFLQDTSKSQTKPSSGSNAAKNGAKYELYLRNRLESAFEKVRRENEFTGPMGNISVEIPPLEVAGSGGGHDLDATANLTFGTSGHIRKGVRIEAKHIKDDKGSEQLSGIIKKGTSGLDFGAFTLLYVLNKGLGGNPDVGCWIANVNGDTWKGSGGKNEDMIISAVKEMNTPARRRELANIAPKHYEDEEDRWNRLVEDEPGYESVLEPKNIEIMVENGLDPYDPELVIINGIPEKNFRVPNEDGSFSFNKNNFQNQTYDKMPIEHPTIPKNVLKANPVLTVKNFGVDGTGDSLCNQLVDYYARKGDDFVQIKHYGLFALRNIEEYNGSSPPCPPHWYDDDLFYFKNVVLSPPTKITLRLRYKYRNKGRNDVRTYTCSIKYELPRTHSPYHLSNDKDLQELVEYWNVNLHKLQKLNAKSQEAFYQCKGKGCSVMGGTKRRRKRSSKTRKCRRRKCRPTRKRKRRVVSRRRRLRSS